MDLRKALGLDQAHIGQEENTCSYEIYPAPHVGQSEVSAAITLDALRTQLLEHLLPFLRDYIWQRDRFALHLSTQREAPWHAARRPSRQRASSSWDGPAAAPAEPPPHLWGCVNFGDNIEDEWFIVWLLLELTRAFPGVCARVWDNDGEFLLIEAAYGLPRWLKPETAQNRVWLHGGAFHLVPPPRFKGDPLLDATPSLAQALAAVRGSEIDTAAPQKMQAALLPRVSGHPAKAAEQAHVAHALVPARVAHLLRGEPQLVAAAVEAFHYRDPDDVRAAARMAAFPPRDMVLVAARFSRCLYAQLALQEYAPPRGHPMPMPSDPQYKAAEVGLKLTAAFEMMYANRARFGRAEGEEEEEGGGGQNDETAGEPAAAAAAQPGAQATSAAAAAGGLEGDAAWAAFYARLQASGYFRGELPGSTQHSALLAAAVDSYRQTAAYRVSTAALAAPARRVDALLAQPINPASFPPPEQLPPEGSESWLQAGAQAQLEAELAQRQAEQEAEAARKAARRRGPAQSGTSAKQHGRGAAGGQRQGDEFDPGDLAGRLHAFVDMMAGLEGAELPGDAPAGERGGGGAGGGASAAGGVSLDEAKFAAELQRVLGLGKEVLRGLEQRTGSGEEDGWSETSDEASSFFSDGEDDEGSDDEEDAVEPPQQRQQASAHQQPTPQQQQQGQPPLRSAAGEGAAALAAAVGREAEDKEERRRQEGWEADTATDSDDDAQFMEAYGQAMDAQLAGTRLVESFERAPTGGAGQPAQRAQQQGQTGQEQEDGDAAHDAAAAAPAAEVGKEAALRPIDIDFNLVNSLLASYGEQQGLPGPAGSLAGLLGVKLPDQPAG